MQNSLINISDKEYNMASNLAADFGTSNLFPAVRSKAQAMVIILVGSEMGVSAIAALTGIHMISGKPVVGANLMAERIKSSGKYDYIVEEHTDKICKIRFMQGDKNIGVSTFTLEDAQKANLTASQSKNWQKYPKNMLFARAISNGQRWFCPDVFGGKTVYTPDEMDAVVNDQGEVDVRASARVIDSPATTPKQYSTLTQDQIKETREAIGAVPNPEASENWIVKAICEQTKESYSSLEELPAKYYTTVKAFVAKLLTSHQERQKKMNELHANLEAFSNLHQLEHDVELVRAWLRHKAGVESMTELTTEMIKNLIIYIKKSVATEDVDEEFYAFFKDLAKKIMNTDEKAQTVEVEATTSDEADTAVFEEGEPTPTQV
jgi:hypothetical protein